MPKVTSKNVPGYGKQGGTAREAGRKVEDRKKRAKSRLDATRELILRNAQRAKKPSKPRGP